MPGADKVMLKLSLPAESEPVRRRWSSIRACCASSRCRAAISRPEACVELAKNHGHHRQLQPRAARGSARPDDRRRVRRGAGRGDRRDLRGLGEQGRAAWLSGPASGRRWTAVDDYIAGQLIRDDPALDAALAQCGGGCPTSTCRRSQGKLLHLLARIGRREAHPRNRHARRLFDDLAGARAGRGRQRGDARTRSASRRGGAREPRSRRRSAAGRVRVGPALETLAALQAAGDGPFDFVFIDADKPNNADYSSGDPPGAAGHRDRRRQCRARGRVLDADTDDPSVKGTRRLFDGWRTSRGSTRRRCRPSAGRNGTAS